jgi:uncharacterized protein (DUF2147 family)
MKTTLLSAVLALGLAGAAWADPLLGTWRTAPDDNGDTGLIEVTVCGTSLCGTLVEAFDSAGSSIASPNIGRAIIWDTNPTGDGSSYRGRIYAPDRDATYNSRLSLSGNTLRVCGRLLGIQRCGGDWTRVN